MKSLKHTFPIDFVDANMGHGQYLVYSSKSSIFEECLSVLSFFRFWEYSKYYHFFEECVIVFQAPAQFPKNKNIEYYFPLR